VVATGIEAESVAQPQPAKVFTFPTRPAAAPVAAASEADREAGDTDTLDLTDEVSNDGEGEGEELLLDSDDILTSPVGSAPIAPPSDDEGPLAEPESKPAEQAPKAAAAATGTGGTLFARMSSIARGAPRAQIEPDQPAAGFSREPIDIPRFLNRQNNQ
jgi:cell division protein FtsZ